MSLIATIRAADNLTLYGVLRKYTFGFAYNTFSSAFESLTPAHWYSASSDNYSLTSTKLVVASGVYAEYAFAMPSPNLPSGMAAGTYWLDVFQQAGAHPAITDGPPFKSIENIYWTGSAIASLQFDASGYVFADVPGIPVVRQVQMFQRNTSYTG